MFPYIRIGPITLRTYSLMALLALLTGYFVARALAKRKKVPVDIVENTILISVLGGIIGARIYYVLEYLDEFLTKPLEIFAIWHGGIAWVGGLIGGTLAGYIYLRLRHPGLVFKVADVIMTALPLAHAVARIGCLGYGCCFGKPTSLPWGLTFPAGSPASCMFSNCLKPSPPVHPTQIYSMVGNLIIFALLLLNLKRGKREGENFFLYYILYGISRGTIDIFRADVPHPFGGPLSINQIILIILAGGAIFGLMKLNKSSVEV